MTSRKRKLVYGLIALLFLLLLAVIIRLMHILLNFRIEQPPAIEQPAPAVPLHTASPGPVSEVLIRIEEEPAVPAADDLEPETGQDAAIEAGHGHIPSICEGYGPQIRRRVAYPNPLTHQTVVSPNRITVILDIRPDAP